MAKPKKPNLHAEVHCDIHGDWYWRLRARNGKIRADGSEGYATKGACIRALKRLVVDLGTVGAALEIRVVE